MLIQIGKNSYRIVKKRSNKKRTLINKREGKKMTAYILSLFVALTLITTVYAQIPPNTVHYNAPVSAPVDTTQLLEVKTVIIAEPAQNLTPSEAEALIRQLAKEANFKWPNYLVKIAKCESQLNPWRSNTGGNHPANSVDRGLYMINNYWHSEVTDEQAYDPVFATKWAMELINKGRQKEFVCDKILKK